MSAGTVFQRLEALPLKKFLLRSSLPFLTFTLKLSAVTLVPGTGVSKAMCRVAARFRSTQALGSGICSI